jgi:hypothetical protein
MSNSIETPPRPPFRVTLDPAIRCGGTEFSELTFDFDSLSEPDFARARLTFGRLFNPKRNKMSAGVAGDLYLCVIIAQAAHGGEGNAGVPVGLIRKLPLRYYTPLHGALIEASGKAINAYLSKVEGR